MKYDYNKIMVEKPKKIPIDRKREIQTYVLQKGSCTIDELSNIFHVSKITIRRDIIQLEKIGKIKSTHGGAIPVTAEKELFFDTKKTLYLEEKSAIAEVVGNIVQDNTTLFMNSGTTTREIAKTILIKKHGVRIITNNYEIPILASKYTGFNNKVILTGGEYHPSSHSLLGETLLNQLDSMYAYYCILGVNGISIGEGLTSAMLYGVTINNKFITQTRGKIIVVADSSKLNTISSFKICNLSMVDMVVTDWNASKSFVKKLKEKNIQVYIPPQRK